MIYLDNAATTFPKPERVYENMDRVNRNLSVNAGRGSYKAAKEAARIISETKETLAELFNCKGIAEIVFTPSVTHAMNQVLRGITLTPESNIYLSPYEHNAVARTVEALRKETGCNVFLLPTEPESLRIDIKKTAYLFQEKKPDLVVVNMVSNVTGYILPAAEIFNLAKSHNAITVADAAQAAGLLPIDLGKLAADILCFAGHKTLYGPFGIAGFAIRGGVSLKQTFTGGTGSDSLNLSMPEYGAERYEASSPNVTAAAGLLAALQDINQKAHEQKIRELTAYAYERLNELQGVTVLGYISKEETIGIISFVVEGYGSEEVGAILDEEYDIAVRTGYHCAPYIHDLLQDKEYAGTIRIGIGMDTSKEDIDVLVAALESL